MRKKYWLKLKIYESLSFRDTVTVDNLLQGQNLGPQNRRRPLDISQESYTAGENGNNLCFIGAPTPWRSAMFVERS